MKAVKVRYNYGLKGLARGLRRNMTPAEKKLWHFLKTLPQPFRRQRPIGPYIVDFYCASAKLVVEIDGESHYTEQGQAYDSERTKYLQNLGLRIIRFANTEVNTHFEGVCLEISRQL